MRKSEEETTLEKYKRKQSMQPHVSVSVSASLPIPTEIKYSSRHAYRKIHTTISATLKARGSITCLSEISSVSDVMYLSQSVTPRTNKTTEDQHKFITALNKSFRRVAVTTEG